jgi:hypothetical protein
LVLRADYKNGETARYKTNEWISICWQNYKEAEAGQLRTQIPKSGKN